MVGERLNGSEKHVKCDDKLKSKSPLDELKELYISYQLNSIITYLI